MSSLKVSQSILIEGIEAGDFIPCDTWKTAHTFWTVATALIEHDGTRGRRLIRQRPLKELYDHSVEVILRGILTDTSESKLAQDSPET